MSYNYQLFETRILDFDLKIHGKNGKTREEWSEGKKKKKKEEGERRSEKRRKYIMKKLIIE